MQLGELFKASVAALEERGVLFAVAGGFAADIYRSGHRVTQDLDVVILTDTNAVELASKIVKSLGLRAGIARKADFEGGPLLAIRRKNTEPYMIVGRRAGEADGTGLDILLPVVPWVPDAVRRAQGNMVDFGFGAIPTITVEDVIIAKLMALKNASSRFKDLDDLQSIFARGEDLDLKYLAGQMSRFGLMVPKTLAKSAPEALMKVSKDVAKTIRGRR